MSSFDTELVELDVTQDTDHGQYRIELYKIGGGTLGRSYDGLWGARVSEPDTGDVVFATEDLYTGTPKTHLQAAEIAVDFAN